MKMKILTLVCLTLALGSGIYMLSPSKQPEKLSLLSEPRTAPKESGLNEPPFQKKEKPPASFEPEKEVKKTRSSDGRTIIKGSLPENLKILNARLQDMAAELDREKERFRETPIGSAGAEVAIKEGDKLIKRLNAEHGINASLVQAEYRKSMSQPITSLRGKAVMEEVKSVNKDLKALESKVKEMIKTAHEKEL